MNIVSRRIAIHMLAMNLLRADNFLVSGTLPSNLGSDVSRYEFVQQLRRIAVGMSKKDVLSRLGPPDFTGHIIDSDRGAGAEIWCYGCAGAFDIPTLGQVAFDQKGNVLELHGQEGDPPPNDVISEGELRHLMTVVDQAPSFYLFNPQDVIAIVNKLIPFGKAKILATVDEYNRVCGRGKLPEDTLEWRTKKTANISPSDLHIRIFQLCNRQMRIQRTMCLTPLLCLLFDPDLKTDQNQPPTVVSDQLPPPPADIALCPEYPLLVLDDVPVCQIRGTSYDGPPYSGLTINAKYYRQYGRIRTKPLIPSGNLAKVYQDIMNSPHWLILQTYPISSRYSTGETYVPTNYARKISEETLKRQLLAAVSHLYPVAVDVTFNGPGQYWLGNSTIDIEKWDEIVADLKSNPVQWDAKSNKFQRKRTN